MEVMKRKFLLIGLLIILLTNFSASCLASTLDKKSLDTKEAARIALEATQEKYLYIGKSEELFWLRTENFILKGLLVYLVVSK